MISYTVKGDLARTESFLKKMVQADLFKRLSSQGQAGVRALAAATPHDSGATAAAWGYSVDISGRSATITWTNSNRPGGAPLAIMLQYGHGTGTGGYVQGRDYINPAMKPVFDKIAEEVWKAVTSA